MYWQGLTLSVRNPQRIAALKHSSKHAEHAVRLEGRLFQAVVKLSHVLVAHGCDLSPAESGNDLGLEHALLLMEVTGLVPQLRHTQ